MIRANFTKDQIAQMMQAKAVNVERAMISLLQELGEKCINEAREGGAYKDRTGNLRSSIGYCIVKDGQVVNLSEPKQYVNGTEGISKVTEYLGKLATRYPKGYVLIVVAGMNYAVYVEARGYNVLTSAELLAEQELPRMLNELFD